jgi:peptide subunit release factor 1 (eRF1)
LSGSKCGSDKAKETTTVEEKDIIDVLEEVASQTDARAEVISPESEEKAKIIGSHFQAC